MTDPGRADLERGSDLHVEFHGEGEPPILLVHGLGASVHSWREWLPHLTPRHRTVAVDLAGFGQSPLRSGADLSPAAQADRLADLVRNLDGPRPVLAGHSLGAGIVLLAALRLREEAPERAPAGLVLVSGAVYAQRLPFFLTLARIPGLGDLLLLPPAPRTVLRLGIQGIVHDRASVDGRMVEGYHVPLRDRRRRRAILRAARAIDVQEAEGLAGRFGEIDVPTLLVWGEEDRIVSPELGRRLADALPDAELVTLSGVGHLPAEEAPQESVRPVLAFLRTLGGSGSARERG